VRILVATTVDDPWAETFWGAYYRAGGTPPEVVCFLRPRRRVPVWRSALEGLLLFGLLGAAGSWRTAQRTRARLLASPERIFAGVRSFHRLGTLNRGEGMELLEQTAPDLLVSVGSPEIFKVHALRVPAVGAVNLHNGRLPAYRGLFGSFWEAFNNEAWGYATVHVMAAEVDAGPVLAQAVVPLRGRSLLEVLAAKKHLGGRLLAWVVRHVETTGVFPPPCPPASGDTAGYYRWPSLREMSMLRLRRLRAGRRPAAAPPIQAWPADLALNDK
jgi:hypothetical protein